MEESDHKDEPEIPPPTAPGNFCVNLQGFSDESSAREFGNLIGNTIRGISCFINLERLDGVTVAYDYDQALTNLDRGYQASRPLTRTEDDHLLGVAMAPAVLREGMVKGHLVLFAPLILKLQLESGEQYHQALYTLAHECGHIEDLKFRDECFPGTILQKQYSSQEESILRQAADVLWEEYAACLKSAIFGPEQSAIYEECFVSALNNARESVNESIRKYRLHGDITRVLEEAGHSLCEPLRMAAYLLGHLDGIGKNWDTLPNACAALERSTYQPFIDRLMASLRTMRSERTLWQSMEVYDPLCDIVRSVFKHGGLVLSGLPDGSLYVDVPFTSETMP